MKFGLAWASGVGADPASALEICRRAEALGFDSVWGGEHVVIPANIESRYPYTKDGRLRAGPEKPILDPLIWLSYVAAAAPTLKLGTCILILPQRNPLVLAKELATLDLLSGGRVELGIGVGWMREEFDALGIPWERRGARNDEYVAAMRALWANEVTEFHGEFVDFDPVTCSPRPVNGRIPILVGGDTPVAIQRAARLADGYFPATPKIEKLKELVGQLHQALKEHDRKPEEVEINAVFAEKMSEPEVGIEEMEALGVGRAMVPAAFFTGPDGFDRMTKFGETVVQKYR